jgi:DNA-binding NarL/FixJ family response regulator
VFVWVQRFPRASAVEEATKAKPNVAVLGYELPLMRNGVEVTRQIRAKTPKTEGLICTAQDDEEAIFLPFASGRAWLRVEVRWQPAVGRSD